MSDGDIAKCADDECPSRLSCWRFTVPEAEHQVYADFGRKPKAFRCEHFASNRDGDG